MGGLAIVALAGASARPELWSAGPVQVLLAVGAATGTGASACVALAALLGPCFAARRLVTGGEAAALESLGWGRRDLVRAWAPIGLVATLAAAGAGLGVEPIAWRAVHAVKGSPALAAASWARLQAGEVAALGDGGALVLRNGALRFTTGDGAWTGELSSLRPAAGGWAVEGAVLRGAAGEGWSADGLELRLAGAAAASWSEAPRSPWAAGPRALLRRTAEPRAERVLHRRVALILAVLPLGLLGLCLGWSRRRGVLWLVPAVPFIVFLAARWADTAALSPVLAGWVPAIVAVLCAGLGWWRLPS